ncbi:hypothetical protein C2S51_007769 [Perilla frutescens var. frutescens]|nr:hypothetical protein C2S51_007769 [Perilla frutescens var. frutescens]
MENSSSGSMIKLVSNNYSIWKAMMEDLLHCKDLYDPVKGASAKPEEMSDNDWAKLGRKTISTIHQWVDISVFHHVAKETDPCELWKKLRELYERKNAHNKAFVIRKLVNLKYKDGSSVAEHLNVFQDLVNQLSTMELVFDDEVQALFLLSSLSDS